MARSRYDDVADFYVEGFDSVDDPVSQALLSLLGPVEGLRVLDVACGHGRVTRELARARARRPVTGVDSSGALLREARQKEQDQPLGIRYIHADVTAGQDWLEGGGPDGDGPDEDWPDGDRQDTAVGFDAVTCHYGLSDIDDLDGALRAISAALRPGGRFVFSILHPCFPGGGDVAGAWPATGSYYDERFWRADTVLSALRRRVGANHRTLSTYVSALHRHDLRLDEVAEPRPDESWIVKAGPAAARHPVQFVARCLKPEA